MSWLRVGSANVLNAFQHLRHASQHFWDGSTGSGLGIGSQPRLEAGPELDHWLDSGHREYFPTQPKKRQRHKNQPRGLVTTKYHRSVHEFFILLTSRHSSRSVHKERPL